MPGKRKLHLICFSIRRVFSNLGSVQRAIPGYLIGLLALLSYGTVAQNPVATPSPTASPQSTPAAENDVLRVATKLVQVEAIVRDKNGKLVTDLTADEFEIVESGAGKRSVEFFSFVPATEKRGNLVPVDNRLTRSELRRTVVFILSNPVIDLVFSNAGRDGIVSGSTSFRTRAMRAAEDTARFLDKFIDKEMGERDLISILDAESDLGVLSSFTNDREILHAAVKQLRSNLGQGHYATVRVTVVNGNMELHSLVEQNLATIGTAQNAVEQLRGLPGRKVVVLLSNGLLSDPRLPGANVVLDKLKQLIVQANKAQVTFYTLGLSGVGNIGGVRGDNLFQGLQDLDSVKDLATETGGRSIYNTNDVSIGFNDILKENMGYYLLAYDPEQGGSPAHQVSVRVKRPGLSIQSRSNVYRSEPVVEKDGDTENLLRILRSPLSTQGIRITLASAYQPVSNTRGSIETSVNIDPSGFETELVVGNQQQIKINLAIQVIGPDNKIVRQQVKNFTLKLSKESWATMQTKGLVYQFSTESSKNGFYQVNVAACINNSAQCGSASHFVRAAMITK